MPHLNQHPPNPYDEPIATLYEVILGCLENCAECKRTMVPGEIYANGYDDGPTICNACKQKHNHERETNKYFAHGSLRDKCDYDIESTEHRYGQ